MDSPANYLDRLAVNMGNVIAPEVVIQGAVIFQWFQKLA